MRIAHVVCTDAFAGVERYVADVAVAQHAGGHAVTVVGGDRGAMVEALAGTDVLWRPGATPHRAGMSLVRAATGRWTHRPEVVHAHMTAAELVALATQPVHRAPVVATLHFARRRGGDGARAALWGRIGPRLAAQVAISDAVAEASGEAGRATVVHSGVPAPEQPPVPADERAPMVAMVQRMEPEKATDVGLRAWAASGLGERGWRLEVVGRGSQLLVMERLAAELGVAGSVRFRGWVRDARAVLARASMLMAPCPIDGFGLTVVEAMAAGTPVVAAAAAGHLETVGSVSDRWLFAPGDVAVAGALLRDLAGDAAERRTYGAALAAAHAERFSVAGHAAALDDVYAGVVRSSPSAAAGSGAR